ncbi:MAG: DUF5317 domain-containing protein [Thermomicrobiales bacterium]|nr:DUF5317 domain-containing protein [Thermomicrobiales bacterium]
MILLLAIGLALIVGYLTGGSLGQAHQARLRALPLFFGAAFVQVLIFTPLLGTRSFIQDNGQYIYIGTVLASLAAILLNLSIPGMKIMAIGAALNALVIIANGGFMPSTEAALDRAGKLETVERAEAAEPGDDWVLTNSIIADDDTRLLFREHRHPGRLAARQRHFHRRHPCWPSAQPSPSCVHAPAQEQNTEERQPTT